MSGHIWLVGMMGSGKSAVGRELSRRLGRPFADTDDRVVARVGCPIAEYWEARGEAAFREVEATVVAAVAAEAPSVVATGGGVVIDAANVAAMRHSGLVVWLRAGPRVLAARTGRANERPLLHAADTEATLRALLNDREALYDHAAHIAISTETLDVATVAQRIEELWNES